MRLLNRRGHRLSQDSIMGKPTDITVHTVRSTHRGSDYYGNCELCRKACAEHFVATRRRVWVRSNGQRYLDHGGGGTYGHLDCLTSRFGKLISQETLRGDGRVLLLPETVFDELHDLQSKCVSTSEADRHNVSCEGVLRWGLI